MNNYFRHKGLSMATKRQGYFSRLAEIQPTGKE